VRLERDDTTGGRLQTLIEFCQESRSRLAAIKPTERALWSLLCVWTAGKPLALWACL